MSHSSVWLNKMRVLLLSLALLSLKVNAQNHFLPIPLSFSFITPTVFYWTDLDATWITELAVRGDFDPRENLELPLSDSQCTSQITSLVGSNRCIQWFNNGTGTFGGSYAAGLKEGHTYHFNLHWTRQDHFNGESNSTVFSMTGPIQSSTTSSTSSSTSSSSTSVSTLASSQTASPTNSPSTTPTTAGIIKTLSPTATVSPTTVSNAKKKGLAAGAIAGISIAAVAAILIPIIVFLLWRRYRSQNKHASELDKTSHEPSYANGYHAGGEVPTDSSQKEIIQQELERTPHTYTHEIIAGQRDYSVTPQPQARMPELPNQHFIASPKPAGELSPSPRRGSQSSSQFAPSTGRAPSLDDERNMSPEEIARLEDEERRIEEAIRESERLVEERKKRGTG